MQRGVLRARQSVALQVTIPGTMDYWERRLAAPSDVTKPTSAIACKETRWINLTGICEIEKNASSAIFRMKRTILKTIFEPFVIVAAAVYFFIDALALSILKPLLRKIDNLKVFELIAVWIASLGPYPTLALFAVPLVLLEPIKPLSAYIIASGHIKFGLAVLILGEVLKITIVERIFHIGRDKLMTITAFAWIYNFAFGWLTWLQALPAWQFVKHNFDDFIRWAHKLNHDGRARGFR
jgi:hypothetical protein